MYRVEHAVQTAIYTECQHHKVHLAACWGTEVLLPLWVGQPGTGLVGYYKTRKPTVRLSSLYMCRRHDLPMLISRHH